MFKSLIIPLEIQTRELEPTINLVIEALKKNWIVFLGQKQQIFPFIKSLPRSVWYLKSIVPGEHSLIKKIYDSKHLITTLDIEGLIPANMVDTYKQRYSIENIKKVKKIFFWGNYHYKNFKKTFKKINNNKLVITGSPIADEWIETFSNFKKKEKKQILIISSFGFANTKTKKLNLRMALDNIKIKNIESKKTDDFKFSKKIRDYIKLDYEAHKEAYLSFLRLIPKLCNKFKKYKIVLRPHPNDNVNMWKKYLKEYDNLKIDNYTKQSKQIIESKAIIHFNSTMSVQSSLADKNIILYYGIDNKYLKTISPIVKKLSIVCKSHKNVFKMIQYPKKKKKHGNIFLKNLIKRTDFSKNKASEEIIRNLETIKINNDGIFDFREFNNKIKFKIKYLNYQILNSLVVPFLSFFSFIKIFEKYSHGNIYRKYGVTRKILLKQKWKDLSVKKLKKKFINKKNINPNFLKKIKIHKHFSGMFIIEKI